MSLNQPVDYIERTRTLYESLSYPPYGWVRSDSAAPLAVSTKPGKECRVALIGSGGIYARGQIAFHHKDDISFRIIDPNTSIADLRVTHFAYDMTSARQDINCVLPLEPLRHLQAEGTIADSTVYTLMGGIYSSRRVTETLAPALTATLIQDEVDLAILVPV